MLRSRVLDIQARYSRKHGMIAGVRASHCRERGCASASRKHFGAEGFHCRVVLVEALLNKNRQTGLGAFPKELLLRSKVFGICLFLFKPVKKGQGCSR